MESGFIGLFDLVVKEAYRGQGVGRQLINQILAYGQSKGCHTAYLQVEQKNTIANHLYHQLGFVEQYEYWYRIKPSSELKMSP